MAAAIATLLTITAVAQDTSASAPTGDGPRKTPIVEACVDQDGKLVSARIFESSGYPELDEAALKIARANTYNPGTENGKKKELSCVKFKVKFVIKDGETPGAVPPAETPTG